MRLSCSLGGFLELETVLRWLQIATIVIPAISQLSVQTLLVLSQNLADATNVNVSWITICATA